MKNTKVCENSKAVSEWMLAYSDSDNGNDNVGENDTGSVDLVSVPGCVNPTKQFIFFIK